MTKRFSRQTGWFITLLLLIGYLLWTFNQPDPQVASKMHRNMMAMTTGALQEAVIFAHMKYHALGKANSGEQLDLLEISGEMLDFNAEGFPVGINHNSDSIKLPIRSTDCRQLWQLLLAPMRPYVQPEEHSSIRVEAFNGECVFTSTQYSNYKIKYSPKKGKVSFWVL